LSIFPWTSPDFGQLEQMIQGKIDKNRGKARVAADLSQEGLASIQAEEKMEKVMPKKRSHSLRSSWGCAHRKPQSSLTPPRIWVQR